MVHGAIVVRSCALDCRRVPGSTACAVDTGEVLDQCSQAGKAVVLGKAHVEPYTILQLDAVAQVEAE